MAKSSSKVSPQKTDGKGWLLLPFLLYWGVETWAPLPTSVPVPTSHVLVCAVTAPQSGDNPPLLTANPKAAKTKVHPKTITTILNLDPRTFSCLSGVWGPPKAVVNPAFPPRSTYWNNSAFSTQNDQLPSTDDSHPQPRTLFVTWSNIHNLCFLSLQYMAKMAMSGLVWPQPRSPLPWVLEDTAATTTVPSPLPSPPTLAVLVQMAPESAGNWNPAARLPAGTKRNRGRTISQSFSQIQIYFAFRRKVWEMVHSKTKLLPLKATQRSMTAKHHV